MIQEVLPSFLMKNPTDKLRPKCLLNIMAPSLCLDLLVLGLGVRESNFFLWGAEWRGRGKKEKHCYWELSNMWLHLQQGRKCYRPSRFVLTKSGKAKALFFPTLWYQQINYIWNFFSTCWAGPQSVQRPPSAHSGLPTVVCNFWSVKMTFITTGLGWVQYEFLPSVCLGTVS